MKLTQEQMKQAYNEVTVGHHGPIQTIIRLGGDKEDYQKLYQIIKGYAAL
uniref:ORF2 n=1 Tax=Nitrosopumilaceae spindle-shaped virus TaxID=3065433 RepID=A0AAT9JGZ9_9VIRU